MPLQDIYGQRNISTEQLDSKMNFSKLKPYLKILISILTAALIVFITLYLTQREVTSSEYVCRPYTDEYLLNLLKVENHQSAQELATYYVECNDNQNETYKNLAVYWSEQTMKFKEATQDDLRLYRAIHNLDTETGEPEKE
jgi:6-pyruvoyl-tetrahydropterin synthase